MRLLSPFTGIAALLAAAVFPLAANATVLLFDSTAVNGGLANYGDRVSGSPQAGINYDEGAGWTPNVTLSFNVLDASTPAPAIYAGGYGTLVYALGHTSYDKPLRLDFTPDAGFAVTLNSFDIATWASASYSTNIRIWDDRGSFDQPNLLSLTQTYEGSTVYSPLSAALAASGTLHLYVSNLGSTGLDNIHFTQNVTTVPEASSLATMGLGLAVLLAAGNRRSRG